MFIQLQKSCIMCYDYYNEYNEYDICIKRIIMGNSEGEFKVLQNSIIVLVM